MNDYAAELRHEFGAEKGSFLVQLRRDLVWDDQAFARLVRAMEQCAAAHEGRDVIDRWVAEGFWYVEWFVRDWTTNPNFPRQLDDAAFDAAYQLLRDLSYWLFVGERPHRPTAGGARDTES